MDKPAISIIVPVYNVDKYVKRCINSVLNQTFHNFELILVDDGSTDQSIQICRESARIDNRIVVKSKENEGAGYARNMGINLAQGKYLMFIDADDYIIQNCLERLYTVAEKENCDIIKFRHKEGSLDNYNRFPVFKKYKTINHIDAFRSRKVDVCIWGKLFRRETIAEIRYPKVSTHDDEFITYKLIYNANNIIVLDEAYYYYYMSANSIMRKKRDILPLEYRDAYIERIQFFRCKGEEELEKISHKEFAIRLMLSYLSYQDYKQCVMTQEELYEEFKYHYQAGKETGRGLKEKYSLFLFYNTLKFLDKLYSLKANFK